MARARDVVVCIALASCKSSAPEQVAANGAKADGVEVKTRRSTAMNGKLAWGGLVTNASDRFVKGVDLSVVARKGGGTAIGQGKGHVDLLPPGYGVLLEVNGIALDGAPASVDVVLEHVDGAPPEEQPFEWTHAAVTWEKPLPAGVAFTIEKDEKCAGVLGKKGEPTTFRCVVGVKHTGTVPARVTLWFAPARGGTPIAVKAPYATDLGIEPGDALVHYVQATMTTPSETILKGSAKVP
jgi:hypothetical protein